MHAEMGTLLNTPCPTGWVESRSRYKGPGEFSTVGMASNVLFLFQIHKEANFCLNGCPPHLHPLLGGISKGIQPLIKKILVSKHLLTGHK